LSDIVRPRGTAFCVFEAARCRDMSSVAAHAATLKHLELYDNQLKSLKGAPYRDIERL
jgi:hypothetical protein